MDKLLEILILAVVQGIGEFLPISSSGHLNVANDIFQRLGSPEIKEQFMVGVLLHFGTLLAVFIVFWKRILLLLSDDKRVIPLIIFASIPVAIVGFPIEKYCDDLLESPLLTGFCFIGTALLLLYSANKSTGDVFAKDMSFKTAFIIGCFQAIAILPGFSRSGFTIVGGLLCKLRREEAATFSFLLAIPVIGGKGLLDLIKVYKLAGTGQTESVEVLMIGVFVSFIVGLISLTWLMKWLQSGKLHFFAYWLLILGPIVIIASLFFPTKSVVPPTGVLEMTAVAQDGATAERNREIVQAWKENRTTETETEKPAFDVEFIDPEPTFYEKYPLFVPTIDCPGERLISLDENDPIWISRDRKNVVLLGNICLREGLLEFFACRKGSKEHESIVSLAIKPFLIHAALLVIGAEPGKPAQFSPKFVPAQGPEINIKVVWRDEEGIIQSREAQEFVMESVRSPNEKKREMSVPFVFTGSMFRNIDDENGKQFPIYMADATGEIFGVSNFPASILDVPIRSSDSNEELLFQPYTERIPPVGTPITLILSLAD